MKLHFHLTDLQEKRLQKKQVQNSNQDSVVVHVPKGLQNLVENLQGPVAPIGPAGPYVTGGPAGPDILYTGIVPVSNAPLLDTFPAGAVEGLIGAGPLLASEKTFTDHSQRSYKDLPQIFHRSATHKNQFRSFQITAVLLAPARHPQDHWGSATM